MILRPIWTEAAVATLKRLWGEGLSTRLIAEQIPGATRNAIIGKAHRLKLPAHRPVRECAEPRPISRSRQNPGAMMARIKARAEAANRQHRANSEKPHGNKGRLSSTVIRRLASERNRPRILPVPRIEEGGGTDVSHIVGIGLMELTTHTCRWPVGDATGEHQQFCGCEPAVGSPYCPAHSVRAFWRPAEKLEAAE